MGGEDTHKKKRSPLGFALTVAMETENIGIFSISDLGKSQTVHHSAKMGLMGKYTKNILQI